MINPKPLPEGGYIFSSETIIIYYSRWVRIKKKSKVHSLSMILCTCTSPQNPTLLPATTPSAESEALSPSGAPFAPSKRKKLSIHIHKIVHHLVSAAEEIKTILPYPLNRLFYANKRQISQLIRKFCSARSWIQPTKNQTQVVPLDLKKQLLPNVSTRLRVRERR